MNNIMFDGGLFIMLCGISLWYISRIICNNIIFSKQYGNYVSIAGTIFTIIGVCLMKFSI